MINEIVNVRTLVREYLTEQGFPSFLEASLMNEPMLAIGAVNGTKRFSSHIEFDSSDESTYG